MVAYGVNDEGDLVGYYQDAEGNFTNVLARPPEPGEAAFLLGASRVDGMLL
jgi:hypothetical protein